MSLLLEGIITQLNVEHRNCRLIPNVFNTLIQLYSIDPETWDIMSLKVLRYDQSHPNNEYKTTPFWVAHHPKVISCYISSYLPINIRQKMDSASVHNLLHWLFNSTKDIVWWTPHTQTLHSTLDTDDQKKRKRWGIAYPQHTTTIANVMRIK